MLAYDGVNRRPPRADDLKGILVTGASSEIGRALCRRLVQGSIPILGTYRSRRPADLAIELPSEGIDLASQSGLDRLLKFVGEHFEGPFALAHCVGDFWDHMPLTTFSPREARDMMCSHYDTLYGVLHCLLPQMASLGGGRIVALSCTSTTFSYPEMAPFTSAKAAVDALVKCVANEWARAGISANSLALSTVGTDAVVNSPSKPLSGEESYVTVDEAAEVIDALLRFPSPFLSGNVIRPIKYSDTFYNRAYYERNPRIRR